MEEGGGGGNFRSEWDGMKKKMRRLFNVRHTGSNPRVQFEGFQGALGAIEGPGAKHGKPRG